MPFRIYSITISCGNGISPNLTTYLCMQNKDDENRPCFALFRRVGTLLVVQFKDVLSRHLRATLPEGESFFSRRCTSLSPKGKAFSLCTCMPLSPRGGESYSAEWEHFWQCNLKISSLDAARHSPRRGKLFSLGTCVPLSPKGKASEKIACYNKKGCASIFLIEAQHLFILSFF